MKKVLIFSLFVLACLSVSAQSSNANIGGYNLGSGAAVPATCKAPAIFTKTTAPQSENICIGGSYFATGNASAATPQAATAQLTAQAGLIAGTTLFTPTVDSVYLLSLTITGQVVSSTTTDTLLAHFTYTSPYSGTGIATANSSAVTFNANLNSNGSLSVVVHCKANTAVQFVTSGGTQAGTGWQYALDVSAIRLF